MIKVCIIENDRFLCETLKKVLTAKGDIEVVSIYDNAEDAIKSIPLIKPDVALVDIDLGMNQMTGIDCIAHLKQDHSSTLFMILTIYEDHQKVFDALSAGALGYVLKSDKPENIISAIHDLFDGGSPMSPSIARKIAQSFSIENQPVYNQASLLTQREREVIELISRGKLEKEVASELYISLKTVKSHITNIYSKLQVRTRVEALNKYFGR